jgi:hypothetical protein
MPTLLDGFNRADEGPPPGSSWATTALVAGDADGWKVVGNQCVQAGAAAVVCTAVFSGSFGPDVEVGVTFVTVPTTTANQVFDLYARVTTPGAGTTDGYRFRIQNNATPATGHFAQLARMDNSVATQLGADLSTDLWADGDKMVLRVIGDQLAGARVRAGVETVLGTRTDGTYSTAGVLAIRGNAADTVIDDFSGGTAPIPTLNIISRSNQPLTVGG